jgi:hypothetical protein
MHPSDMHLMGLSEHSISAVDRLESGAGALSAKINSCLPRPLLASDGRFILRSLVCRFVESTCVIRRQNKGGGWHKSLMNPAVIVLIRTLRLR